MIRVTFDTNILVSATVYKGNEFELLKLAKQSKFKLILSLQILAEFRNVIQREKFGYPPLLVEAIIQNILSICEIVVPRETLDVVKEDPDDDKILECAIAGKANYIISGDNHLLKLKEYNGIKIVKTKDMHDTITKIL
mgnify:CR=1 FL=1